MGVGDYFTMQVNNLCVNISVYSFNLGPLYMLQAPHYLNPALGIHAPR